MDQAAATLAPEDDPKQPINRMETGFPVREASVFLRDRVSQWRQRKEHAGLILQALCELTAESTAPEARGFTNKELAIRAVQLGGRPSSWGVNRDLTVGDEAVCRNTVNGAWKRAEALWETKRKGILERFQERGWPCIPSLFRDTRNVGGRGRATQHKLVFLSAPSEPTVEETPTARLAGTGQLRYYTEDVEQAGGIARALASGWLLTGWRGAVFAGIVALATLVGIVIAWAGLGTIAFAPSGKELASSLLATIIAGAALWWALRPLGLLVRDRITVAPLWLQGMREPWDDRLLELRQLPGNPVNHIFLTRYAASCPICCGPVHVADGRREFHGRLVGRCGRAPNEHVFSFDHVTRTGSDLRACFRTNPEPM